MTLVEMLARAMAEQNIDTQAEAARRIGVSRQAFSLWMKNAYHPRMDKVTLHRLVEFTGETPTAILIAAGLLDESDLSDGGVTDAQPLHFPALARLVPA
jgi:transcriptional regulator with XRE-family HTH domain